MHKQSRLRIRIVLVIMFMFGLLLSASFYALSRALRLAAQSEQRLIQATAVNFAQLYAELRYPGPWESREGILYKGGRRMSGVTEVTDTVSSFIFSSMRMEFGAGMPEVNLRPELPWYEKLFFLPRSGAELKSMEPPPSDVPTITSSGAYLGLRGTDGTVVGWVHAEQKDAGASGSRNNLYMFLLIAGAILSLVIVIVLSAIVFRLSKPIDAIVEEHGKEVRRNAELSRTSRTDPLTGLLNRRGFLEATAGELKDSALDAWLAMFDIDHFKRINDTRGHDCGDLVLAEFAQVVLAGVRKQDYCARWGGEEFIVLFNRVDTGIAERSAERLRAAVESHAFMFAGQAVPVTVTIGLTQLASVNELPQAVTRADMALYQGKEGGRNRVVLYSASQ
jgi:diguanylate cyclase (GGDEF)-like protein